MKKEKYQEFIRGKLVLAPLTRAGNLPFRRLCTEFGADVTVSEMAYARKLVRGEKMERALLRRHPSEKCFGIQLAALQTEEGLEAAKIAVDAGADFIDLNCGCPVDDVTRRGLGAGLLRRPKAIARLVETLVANVECAITVKVRLGWKESEMNALEIGRMVESAGAAALTVHGRTREQRYTRSADWDHIGAIREALSIPVIGNGDILTHYEAEEKQTRSRSAAVMIARGALIKPWIFAELKEGRTWDLSARERLAIYSRLAQLQREHFGDDDLGRRRAAKFMTYQLCFLTRYRYLPAEEYAESSRTHPLLQTRSTWQPEPGTVDALLASVDEKHHEQIAKILVEAGDADEIEERVRELARISDVPAPEESRMAELVEMG